MAMALEKITTNVAKLGLLPGNSHKRHSKRCEFFFLFLDYTENDIHIRRYS